MLKSILAVCYFDYSECEVEKSRILNLKIKEVYFLLKIIKYYNITVYWS